MKGSLGSTNISHTHFASLEVGLDLSLFLGSLFLIFETSMFSPKHVPSLMSMSSLFPNPYHLG